MCCDYGPFVELFHSGFTPQSFWFNQGSLAFPNITFFIVFSSLDCLSLDMDFVMDSVLLLFLFEEIATVIRRILATYKLFFKVFRNGTLADFLKIYLILHRYPKSVVVGPNHFVSKLAISGLPWYANNAKMFSLEGSHHISQCPPFNIHIIRWVMRW